MMEDFVEKTNVGKLMLSYIRKFIQFGIFILQLSHRVLIKRE